MVSRLRSRAGAALRKVARPLRHSWPLRSALERRLRTYIEFAYSTILLRDPDPEGMGHYLGRLVSGEISKEQFVEILRGSDEYRRKIRFTDILTSLHHSRCDFIQGLPRARHILDLGGTHQSDPQGAMVAAGYPYEFERLVIVDLPIEDRHELYQESEVIEQVDTPLGPVHYRYHSMVDLSGLSDGEFDLVYSGQSIEHVTEKEAEQVFEEVMRVLRPGGYFCLDTPNGYICRLQQSDFINIDHKVEYTHEELALMLEKAGFQILEAKGLNYCGRAAARGEFTIKEAAANRGIFHDIRNCYLLAYVCQKRDLPSRSGRSGFGD